jgi:diacylglycerol kinase
MAEPDYRSARWSQKFLHAIRGLRVGSRGDSSFLVHIPTACFVLAAAAQLRVSAIEWCVLILCITIVLAAELLNCALERMARVITQDHNNQVRDALDIAAAGVLVAALGSVVVGAIILGFRLIAYLGWAPLPTGV